MNVPAANQILAINAGSSSIKFALYQFGAALELVFSGAIAGIGGPRASFAVSGNAPDSFERHFAIPEHITAANVLAEWLAGRIAPDSLAAVAHRVVYGGPGFAATQAIDGPMLTALYASSTSEPDHLPHEIHLIEVLRRQFRGAAHIACFDSGFHNTMPALAARLPIPRRYHDLGIRRYGFHGLSCAYLMRVLACEAGPQAAKGRVIIAHLGGGASVTAVQDGHSRDTSMGLTPSGGIMMGKRSGDLDPGLAWHLARSEHMSQSAFHHMVNHESGLLGVSGTSGDIEVLLARCAGDSRAAEAVALFCYQVRKAVCAMSGAIDGIDTLVFSGGVGENAAPVRSLVCGGLSHLGLVLDAERNEAGAAIISSPASRVCVRVMHTDEQWMMAEQARTVLATGSGTETEKQHD